MSKPSGPGPTIYRVIQLLRRHDYGTIATLVQAQLRAHGERVAIQYVQNLARQHGEDWIRRVSGQAREALLNAISSIETVHGPQEAADWIDEQQRQGRPQQEIEDALSDDEERKDDDEDNNSFSNSRPRAQVKEKPKPDPKPEPEPDPEPSAEPMNSMESDNQGGAVEGGEPQAKKPRYIWTHFPNTETAKLRWIHTKFIGDPNPPISRKPFGSTQQTTASVINDTGNGGNWSSNSAGLFRSNALDYPGHDFAVPYHIQLKMTTPYGIVKKMHQESIVGFSQPTWLEYFDSKYTYYHVIETQWKATFNFAVNANINESGNTSSLLPPVMGFFIFWKYTNHDDPPMVWTRENTTIATANPVGAGEKILTVATNPVDGGSQVVNYTADDFLRQGNWHHKHIMLKSFEPNSITLGATYKYGQCKMDIKTLVAEVAGASATPSAEGWNEIGTQPHFPENLNIVIVQDNATLNGTFETIIGARFETEQIIQFKDLRRVYKFPDPGMTKQNASGAYLNTDAAFFMRGAGYG
jgi:hypothetical protein